LVKLTAFCFTVYVEGGIIIRKNILMPTSFFWDVFRLIFYLSDVDLVPFIRDICLSIEGQLSDKLEAMDKHVAFSKYKTTVPGSDEREIFRKVYLDLAHVHRDWKSDNEISL
jgi:hypothetical protein